MQKQWYHKQLRIVQTVMREIDLVNYDAKAGVDYLKSGHANCILVNAGGVVDFFDNETELSRPNRFRTTENVLGDLTREAHAAGIRVMVRVDFRGVEQERYERAPHWFGQHKDGSAQIAWTRIYRPCYNSVYPNQHAVEFIRQMMTKYPIDGVWENSVGFGMGPCYCATCRENYRRDTGKEIPTGDNYAAPEFDDYRAWKAACADAHIRLLRDTVKSFGDDKAFCSEIFGMFHAGNALQTGIDLYNAKDHFDFLVSPAFLTGAGTLGLPYDNLTQGASRSASSSPSSPPSRRCCSTAITAPNGATSRTRSWKTSCGCGKRQPWAATTGTACSTVSTPAPRMTSALPAWKTKSTLTSRKTRNC